MIYTITMPSGEQVFVEADEMVVNERVLLMKERRTVAIVSPQATVVAGESNPFAEISKLLNKKVITPKGKMKLSSVYWNNFDKNTCAMVIDECGNSHFFELSEISFP